MADRRHHPLRGLGVFSIVVTVVVGLVLALFALLTFGLLRGLTGRLAASVGCRGSHRRYAQLLYGRPPDGMVGGFAGAKRRPN